MSQSIPRHIAIIMDGNGRWAKKRFMPRFVGHKKGLDAVRKVIEGCVECGVEALTLFAFSTENWKRPADEVNELMKLFMVALDREVKKLHEHNIRLRIVGDLSGFSSDIQSAVERAHQLTEGNTGLNLSIAANYGGRADIVNAVQSILDEAEPGQSIKLTESMISQRVALSDIPEPDLLIRTGGEQRISNFLLWQMAYSEFYFTNMLWPDFDRNALLEAIDSFSNRQRRFGKTGEQVEAEKNA